LNRWDKALPEAFPFGRGTKSVSVGMSDPRNVAHDKKVKQEKKPQKPASSSGAKSRKGKKAAAQNDATESTPAPPEAAKVERFPGDLERSVAVLSKLKEMEFHARANIETLAGLILAIEDKLKQKEFSAPISALYSTQNGFRTQIAALIEKYEAKCESLKPST
jgi:hypothetical protein